MPLHAKILLVDDSPDILAVLEFYFGHLGAEVMSAATGAEAIALAESRNPDIILMDIRLPDMDGPALANVLRLHGFKGPLIAMSGDSRPSVSAECLLAGCTRYLKKPIALEQLRTLITEHLNSETREG